MHDIRTDAPAPRSAIVVGAGIGGLACAVALRGLGLQVRVLERAPDSTAVGAGITLWPNALAALDHLGAPAAVERAGRVIAESAILEPDGTELSVAPLDAIARDHGPLVALHRADLHAVLLDTAGPDLLTHDAHVTAVVDEEDHAGVVLADGACLTADLLVGADGIRSVVREAIAPETGRGTPAP